MAPSRPGSRRPPRPSSPERHALRGVELSSEAPRQRPVQRSNKGTPDTSRATTRGWASTLPGASVFREVERGKATASRGSGTSPSGFRALSLGWAPRRWHAGWMTTPHARLRGAGPGGVSCSLRSCGAGRRAGRWRCWWSGRGWVSGRSFRRNERWPGWRKCRLRWWQRRRRSRWNGGRRGEPLHRAVGHCVSGRRALHARLLLSVLVRASLCPVPAEGLRALHVPAVRLSAATVLFRRLDLRPAPHLPAAGPATAVRYVQHPAVHVHQRRELRARERLPAAALRVLGRNRLSARVRPDEPVCAW